MPSSLADTGPIAAQGLLTRTQVASAEGSSAACFADVDAPDRFVRMESEHIGPGFSSSNNLVSDALPDEADVDAARRSVADAGLRPHRGRPLPSTQRIAQLMLGPYAHKGGFVYQSDGAGSSQRTVHIGSLGRGQGRGEAADAVTLNTQLHPGQAVGQEVPGLIAPSLRRALNDAEVSAQRACHAKRRLAAQSVRSNTLLLKRHPAGILLPSSAVGNTRTIVAADSSPRVPSATHSAAQDVYSQLEATEAAHQHTIRNRQQYRHEKLLQHDHGSVRRGFDILRPQTSQGDHSLTAAATSGARLPARSASAQGYDMPTKEGDVLAQLSHRRRIPPWVSDADLSLGQSTQQRLFEQPANPPPSAARRQRLIDLHTGGRKHDLLSGCPLSEHRRPRAEERRSLRQAHPSLALSQVFTEK